MWESGWEWQSDAEDHKHKLGVQITPLREALERFSGSVFTRKLNVSDAMTPLSTSDEPLREIHRMVHDLPYDCDPLDWIECFIGVDQHPQKTGRVFCSAFVSLVYTKGGILKPDTDWSMIRPCDLAAAAPTPDQEGVHLVKFTEGCGLGPPQRLCLPVD